MISVPKTVSDGSLACLLHPTSFKIIKLLKSRGKLPISEIASELDLFRLSVCHHLAILQVCGLIQCEYQITDLSNDHKKGKARQYFSLTDKVNQVIADAKKFLNDLEEALK